MKVRATVVFEWDEELSNWEATDEDQMLAMVENYLNEDYSYLDLESVVSLKVEKIP